MNDFEVHPIGTAQELQRLKDLAWDLLIAVDNVRFGREYEDWNTLNKADDALREALGDDR